MNKAYTETELDELVQRSVEHEGHQRASVIPILNEINDALGYIPVEALGKIRRLYAIEKEIKDFDDAKKTLARQSHSVPVLDDLKQWLEDNVGRVPKGSLDAAGDQLHAEPMGVLL